jgi:hypothetical protein
MDWITPENASTVFVASLALVCVIGGILGGLWYSSTQLEKRLVLFLEEYRKIERARSKGSQKE